MTDDRTKIMIDGYKGHAVAFDTRHHRFVFTGPLFDGDQFAASWLTVEQEIDKAETVKAKSDREELKLAVITDDGTETFIKGVHARLGTILFTDGKVSKRAAESYSGGVAAYPNVSWIRDTLARHRELSAELKKIARTLQGYAIGVDRNYGGMTPESYDRMIGRLKTDHAEKTEKAINLGSGAGATP